MRIVYLNPSGQLGGAELSLLDVLASIRRAQPEWSLQLVTGAEGPLAMRAEAIGVPTTILPFPPVLAHLGDAGAGGPGGNLLRRLFLLYGLLRASAAVPAYAKQLRRVLGELSPDVLHTNGFKMHVLGVWARPQSGVPVVWHIRDYVRSRPVMARLLRRYAAGCAAVVAISKSIADDVRSICGDRVKIYVVYNAIDLERFSPAGPTLDLDALAGLPPVEPGTVRVGLLATLARWKGHATFLQALSLLPSDLPLRAYIVSGALYQTKGSQYTLDELRGLASRLGISHKVGFTGFVEEPEAAMRALDIVVHASTEPEPFGRVIAEAMACGRAVIVSQGGGAAEITDDDTDALAYTPGNATILAERMMRLIMNRDLRARLGSAGRVTAKRRFDRDRLATDLIPIYHAVVAATISQPC